MSGPVSRRRRAGRRLSGRTTYPDVLAGAGLTAALLSADLSAAGFSAGALSPDGASPAGLSAEAAESAFGSSADLAAGLAPLPLKSVAYQPFPFSWKPEGLLAAGRADRHQGIGMFLQEFILETAFRASVFIDRHRTAPTAQRL